MCPIEPQSQLWGPHIFRPIFSNYEGVETLYSIFSSTYKSDELGIHRSRDHVTKYMESNTRILQQIDINRQIRSYKACDAHASHGKQTASKSPFSHQLLHFQQEI